MFSDLLTSLPVALAPVPEVGFVLQAGAVGTAIGTVIAAAARRREPSRIAAAWTSLGLLGGVAVAVVDAVA